MKLLIVTQAVDTEDPILGFFVRWIEKFAKHAERVEVICLKEGKHALPENVRVHSLGKEKGFSRGRYVLNFYRYIWFLRHDYNAVFVHMNPEYVILGGPFWRLWGKHLALWYNHPHAGLRLFIATRLAQIVFFTSPYAAPAKLSHAKRMPAGIDTDVFKPQQVQSDRQSLYMQGRISPSKRVHIALDALRLLRQPISAKLVLVGPEDPKYGQELRTCFADLIGSGAAVLLGSRRNEETPQLYAAAGVSINLAAAGHFDKSVLESMACGTPVIVSSPAFTDIVPHEWIVVENDPTALARALEHLIKLPQSEYHALKEHLRSQVLKNHGLSALGDRLFEAFDSIS